MTWPDIALIVIWILFLAVGARLGSLWTGACIMGGFLGALLADYYALPTAELLGGFPGAQAVATVLLYAVGMGGALLPGWFLSKMSSFLFLGLIDSAFGLFTGAFTGFLVVSLFLLFIVPIYPRIEKSKAWRKSLITRPLHQTLEDLFNKPKFTPRSMKEKLTKEFQERALDRFEPATKAVKEKIKTFSADLKKELN